MSVRPTDRPAALSTYKHPQPKVERCPKCRLRIRGPHHDEGAHHNGNVPKNPTRR